MNLEQAQALLPSIQAALPDSYICQISELTPKMVQDGVDYRYIAISKQEHVFDDFFARHCFVTIGGEKDWNIFMQACRDFVETERHNHIEKDMVSSPVDNL